MKITTEHYNQLLEAITPLRDNLAWHKENVLSKDERVRDINKRLRWDAFSLVAPHATPSGDWPLIDTLYKYLDDDHIDTALRKVMKELSI